MNELFPDVLKALDIVRLSWFIPLFNVTLRSETVPMEWQTEVVGHIFKKGDQRVIPKYRTALPPQESF